MTEHGFAPCDYDVFAGLDVDKMSISATFLDQGDLVKSLRMPYDYKNLVSYARNHFSGKRIAFAYEAGPTGFGLHDNLRGSGYTCLVVAPSMIPRAPGNRVKTNRLDSHKIAQSLRGGQLKGIHVPGLSYRHLRHLVKLRDTFVRQLVANKLRIKALFLQEDIAFPETSFPSQWSSVVIEKLKELPLSAPLRFKLNALLANLEFANTKVKETTKEIHRFCNDDEELSVCIRHLRTIPGIGQIVASHLLARIGDFRKIENVRQIGAFLGLTPQEHSTGESVNRSSITHLGDSRLRSKLIQAAWQAVRRDPELAEFYHRVYSRNPRPQAPRKAIVAVARKLTLRIYVVLTEQRPYVLCEPRTYNTLNRARFHLTREQPSMPSGTTRRLGEHREPNGLSCGSLL